MRLLLIDGHYYAYRSFFAIRSLTNSRGEPTIAIYGFVKTIRRMMKDLSPDLGAVVWDRGLPERRTQLQPEYKQQRAEMPADLARQLEWIERVVPMLGFASLGLPDTEADDLIASYACAATSRKIEVVLATNDKDLFQLIEDGVKVYTTNKTELASPKDTHALLDYDKVIKKWGVPPKRIADVLCLVGDSVDNIPGVPGLGPKNAAALIREFGGIDALMANLGAVKSERIRGKLTECAAQVEQNREMVRLDSHLELPAPVEELEIKPRHDELIAACEELEFKSLRDEIAAEAAKGVPPVQGELF